MKIQDPIIEPFFIDIEESQFVLRETKQIDTSHFLSKGEEGEKEVTHGYFINLGHLINKLIQIKLSRERKPVTLQEFWQAWVGYSKKFTSIIDNDIYQWKEETNKRIERIEQQLAENDTTFNNQ